MKNESKNGYGAVVSRPLLTKHGFEQFFLRPAKVDLTWVGVNNVPMGKIPDEIHNIVSEKCKTCTIVDHHYCTYCIGASYADYLKEKGIVNKETADKLFGGKN
jgi:hypothetical protein